MKRILKKILLISLLFSAAVPSTTQASFFSWTTLRNGAIVVTAFAVTAFAWKLSRQRKLNSDFWEAVRKVNVVETNRTLKSGANVNNQTKNGSTTLMYAAWKERNIKNAVRKKEVNNIIELLLKNGADPSIKAKDGTTVLDQGNNAVIIEFMKQETSQEMKNPAASYGVSKFRPQSHFGLVF